MTPDAIKVEAANRAAAFATESVRVERESVTSLARRHGWEVSDNYDDIANTIHFRFDNDGPAHAHGFLWAGSRKLAQAFITNAQGATVRANQEQVERFLIGLECTCPRDAASYYPIDGPESSSVDCAVHQ